MTHRERVLAALSHKQPDYVPIDFGGTVNSSIVVEGYDALKRHWGITDKNRIPQRMTRIVEVDERILKTLDIDTRAVFTGVSSTEDPAQRGQQSYRDAWGIERIKPEHSLYYDQVNFPLSGPITITDVLSYSWPDPDDPEIVQGLKDRVSWIRTHTDCAAILRVPAPFIHTSQYLRGFEDWYTDVASNTAVLEALFDAILGITMEIAKRVLQEVGQEVDVIVCGDDLGMQQGLQMHPDYYRRVIRPRHARYFRQIHALSSAKLLFHSCGSIVRILDDLIDIGVDAVNPVQVSAKGMDPGELKKTYRNRLAFWGAIDTQHVLPYGSVEDVKNEVEQRIEQLGEGGGYVLAAVHNIQPDVPVENIRAMFCHAREYVPSFMRR